MLQCAAMTLRAYSSVLPEVCLQRPDTGAELLKSVTAILSGLPPGSLRNDPAEQLVALGVALDKLASSVSAALIPSVCNCTIALALVVGDTDKIVAAAHTMLSSKRMAGIKLQPPQILRRVDAAIRAVAFPGRPSAWNECLRLEQGSTGSTLLASWKVSVPMNPSSMSQTLLAVDDGEVFLRTGHQLSRLRPVVGSASATIIKAGPPAEVQPCSSGDWLGFVGGRLYQRLGNEGTGLISEVDRVTLAPMTELKSSSSERDAGSSSMTLFSTGPNLGVIEALPKDGWEISYFVPSRGVLDCVSRRLLPASTAKVVAFGQCSWDREASPHILPNLGAVSPLEVIGGDSFGLALLTDGTVKFTGKCGPFSTEPLVWCDVALPRLLRIRSLRVSPPGLVHGTEYALFFGDDGSVCLFGEMPGATTVLPVLPIEGDPCAVAGACVETVPLDGAPHARLLFNAPHGNRYVSGMFYRGDCVLLLADGSTRVIPVDAQGNAEGMHDANSSQERAVAAMAPKKMDEGSHGSVENFKGKDASAPSSASTTPYSNPLKLACYPDVLLVRDPKKGKKGKTEPFTCSCCRLCLFGTKFSSTDGAYTVCRDCAARHAILKVAGDPPLRLRGLPVTEGWTVACAATLDRQLLLAGGSVYIVVQANTAQCVDKKIASSIDGADSSGKQKPDGIAQIVVETDRSARNDSIGKNWDAKAIPWDIPHGDEPPVAAKISAGAEHVVVLTTDGRVFGFGSDAVGQLGGAGLSKGVKTPFDAHAVLRQVPLPPGVRVKQISAGGSHTLFLSEAGELFSCGRSSDGQLGREAANKADAGLVLKVTSITKFVASIAASGNRSYAMFGDNRASVLGLSRCQAFGSIADITLLTTSSASESPPRCVEFSLASGHCRTTQVSPAVVGCAVAHDMVRGTMWTFDPATSVLSLHHPLTSRISGGHRVTTASEARVKFTPALLELSPASGLPQPPHTMSPAQVGSFLLTKLCVAPIGRIGVAVDAAISASTRTFGPDDYSAVHRFTGKGGGWGYSSRSVDAVCFSVDQAVSCGGFGIWGGGTGIKFDAELYLRVHRDQEVIAEGACSYSVDSQVGFGSHLTYHRAMFDEPVMLQPGTTYSASVIISSDNSSDCGSCGGASVTADGVTFTFTQSSESHNGTDQRSGQIPAILFRHLGQSGQAGSRETESFTGTVAHEKIILTVNAGSTSAGTDVVCNGASIWGYNAHETDHKQPRAWNDDEGNRWEPTWSMTRQSYSYFVPGNHAKGVRSRRPDDASDAPDDPTVVHKFVVVDPINAAVESSASFELAPRDLSGRIPSQPTATAIARMGQFLSAIPVGRIVCCAAYGGPWCGTVSMASSSSSPLNKLEAVLSAALGSATALSGSQLPFGYAAIGVKGMGLITEDSVLVDSTQDTNSFASVTFSHDPEGYSDTEAVAMLSRAFGPTRSLTPGRTSHSHLISLVSKAWSGLLHNSQANEIDLTVGVTCLRLLKRYILNRFKRDAKGMCTNCFRDEHELDRDDVIAIIAIRTMLCELLEEPVQPAIAGGWSTMLSEADEFYTDCFEAFYPSDDAKVKLLTRLLDVALWHGRGGTSQSGNVSNAGASELPGPGHLLTIVMKRLSQPSCRFMSLFNTSMTFSAPTIIPVQQEEAFASLDVSTNSSRAGCLRDYLDAEQSANLTDFSPRSKS